VSAGSRRPWHASLHVLLENATRNKHLGDTKTGGSTRIRMVPSLQRAGNHEPDDTAYHMHLAGFLIAGPGA